MIRNGSDAILVYARLREQLVMIRAIDPGDPVVEPKRHTCRCGCKRSNRTKDGDYRCAHCGLRWPLNRVVECRRKGSRTSEAPHQRELDLYCDISLCLARLGLWQRRVLILFVLWPGHGRRTRKIRDFARSEWPRAKVRWTEKRIHELVDTGLFDLEIALMRADLIGG